MVSLIIRIYNYLASHRVFGVLSLAMTAIVLAFLLMGQNYKEDISDFLPLNNKYSKALKIYQDISGANRLFAIFEYVDSTKSDPDSMVVAIDHFADIVQGNNNKGMVKDVMTRVDLEKFSEVADFLYEHIPYFLTDADYARFDSLMKVNNYVKSQIALDKQMLMFPVSGLLAENFRRDPLNLFTPIVSSLQQSQTHIEYENYEGYLFSADMKRGIVMMTSPFGASETEHNTQMLEFLKDCASATMAICPNVKVHFVGGPVIAVGNSSQIKADSMLSVMIAVVLIVLLLFLVFRNVWNLLLVVLSIAWGWLFAMGALALIHDSISVIVVGISSVILGIAVNYPLHLIAHLQHTPDVRTALKEIVSPLLVGNITTVGAFLALVPLHSVALSDLGLFSSMLLVGTILFVLIYLPHLVRVKRQTQKNIFGRLGDFSPENSRWVVWATVVLTIVFGYFSLDISFDSDMSHINYMTKQQQADMDYFQKMISKNGTGQSVYVVSSDSTYDGALQQCNRLRPVLQNLKRQGLVSEIRGGSQFLSSRMEQKHRLEKWKTFVAEYGELLETQVRCAAQDEGFADDTFDGFFRLLHADFKAHNLDYFDILTSTLFASNLASDEQHGVYSVVDILMVDSINVAHVIDAVEGQAKDGQYAFDIRSMNSSIATRISDDFNYIGWACGLIVFFFLWFSLGSIELAMLSFLPMALSWLWILGVMSLLGIEFNVVNVILATFIFGQGDDYTIFMTEGCQYEYAYRKKMLASYKHSIIISALIMLIGIGTLIVARHPALHSLAEVTIAGMFSVVLMAYIFPPLIFKFLVRNREGYRKRPISLIPLLLMGGSSIVFFCQLTTVHVWGFLTLCLLKPTKHRREKFHRYIQRLYHYDLTHIPTVKYQVENICGEGFEQPTVIVSNHQSMLDSAVFWALSPKLVLVSNGHPSSNWVVKRIYRWLGCVILSDDMQENLTMLRERVRQGYSLVVFPEGERNEKSSILRFHKGAFYIAEQLGLDVVPVFLHGLNDVLPRNSFVVYGGNITVSIRQRILLDDVRWGDGYVQRTKNIHAYYVDEYAKIASKTETAHYYHGLVLDRYQYKGTDIYRAVRNSLKRFNDYSKWVDEDKTSSEVLVVNQGYGEFALLYALVHKDVSVSVYEPDEEKSTLLYYCAEGLVSNLKVINTLDATDINANECQVFTFDASNKMFRDISNVKVLCV